MGYVCMGYVALQSIALKFLSSYTAVLDRLTHGLTTCTELYDKLEQYITTPGLEIWDNRYP